VLALLYAVTTIDGFFPPVPSESAVIGLAALPASRGGPEPWLIGMVAALGAFTGDQVAYSLGRRVPVRSLRVMRSRHAQKAIGWAETTLARRGAACIVAGRFVPGGRVAVNMTAGAIGYSRARFSAIAAVASVLWAAYSTALGGGAGHLLEGHHPLAGVGVGVLGGLVTGVVVDRVLELVRRRRSRPALPAVRY
jgi:membrane protein DedA with SNARE-associated domain